MIFIILIILTLHRKPFDYVPTALGETCAILAMSLVSFPL